MIMSEEDPRNDIVGGEPKTNDTVRGGLETHNTVRGDSETHDTDTVGVGLETFQKVGGHTGL